ncbi:MAG TPA: hypothetical protein VFS44_11810 [Gemmatimonadaceae bacterium]|nr:hypothetical protein [Gemmatimonadaceae bacterium]
MTRAVGVRWTVGDVSPFGFEALRASMRGCRRVFGEDARYAVVVNSISPDEARRRVGEVPAHVEFLAASVDQIPPAFAARLDPGLAEGVAWKLAPPRVFPDRFELALDNDCILWEMPTAVRAWLDRGEGCVIAEDVQACFGRFAPLAGGAPRNSGIRGLPPGFDLAVAIAGVLREHPAPISSELDEQGLQVAAVARAGAQWVVGIDEVSICSPFPPHQPELGRCGAHFVGVNVRHAPWELDGRPAVEWLREHWLRWREEVLARTGAPERVAV